MKLKNGTLSFKNGSWYIDQAPPHVCIKLKSVFPSIAKSAINPFKFADTPEICADLVWFTDRYPMEISSADLKLLVKSKRKYDKFQIEMERILLPDYLPQRHQFKDGIDERNYQATARELYLNVKRMVCGDDLGLGKTAIAMGSFMDPRTLPALVVVQTHLPAQWKNNLAEFTNLTVHSINGTKPYNLPKADVYIMKYSCLAGWSNFFETGFFKSVTFDEIQELRCEGSQKYNAAKVLSSTCEYVLGLTATLIYNYGNEAYNIMNVVKKGCLGSLDEFTREWAGGYGRIIKDPAAFGSYLRSQHLFLRRTRKEVGRELPAVNKIIHEVEVDDADVKKVEALAIQLSMKIMTGSFHEAGEASRQFDIMMRMNTGISKAREVANYAKILLEAGEPIILVGWHRDVYEIWLEELKEHKPVMFTGSESGNQKENAKQKFLAGETNLLIMSLRSGPGTDGLQKRCCTMIIGELDWSPGVHNQLIGRIDRDGQQEHVTVVYIVCNQGSDPTMMDVLGLKASQSAHINDPELGVTMQESDDSRIKQLAKNYLEKRGIKLQPEEKVEILPPGEQSNN